MKYKQLKSNIDDSVNFFTDNIETRYVRRNEDKASFYISSATGCNKLCKFCHLTATKQFNTKYQSIADITLQVTQLMEHYNKQHPANRINVNFMARGEPLDNPEIKNYSDILAEDLSTLINQKHKINISTIMPNTLTGYEKIFTDSNYYMYYSIYSLDKDFRNEWMPNAMDPEKALDILVRHSAETGNPITFHSAFIKGQNDSLDNIHSIIQLIAKKTYLKNIKCNIVRYNPFDNSSKETDRENLQQLYYRFARCMPTKIVDRVGFDIKASCGMFLP